MVRAGATRASARGVTDLAIGSSDWLALLCMCSVLNQLLYIRPEYGCLVDRYGSTLSFATNGETVDTSAGATLKRPCDCRWRQRQRLSCPLPKIMIFDGAAVRYQQVRCLPGNIFNGY